MGKREGPGEKKDNDPGPAVAGRYPSRKEGPGNGVTPALRQLGTTRGTRIIKWSRASFGFSEHIKGRSPLKRTPTLPSRRE